MHSQTYRLADIKLFTSPKITFPDVDEEALTWDTHMLFVPLHE